MSTKSKKMQESLSESEELGIKFREWSDAELNMEKWDAPKNGHDGHFLDIGSRVLPPSIENPYDWKRASKLVNISRDPVVFTPSKTYPDFISNNKHILHSEFVRWFISTIINLQYVGREGLQIDNKYPNFIWPGEFSPWQGWMHVYSMNKAGNLSPNNQPIVNPHGKYVVRLFFMGSWRRLVIDDMIPVDRNDTPLLPRTEKDFELWPMILAKAMIKLASLSWTREKEIRDFYPVTCFTGWICLPLRTNLLTTKEKWNLLSKYVDNEKGELAEMPANKENDLIPKKQDPSPNVAIFANLEEVSRCWSHPVYIDKLRNTSLDTNQIRWKTYRYFAWASRQGILKPGNDGLGRTLKLITPLKESMIKEEEWGQDEPEIVVWIDFSEIAESLDEILLFYKPSDFQYYSRISDAIKITTGEISRTKFSGRDSKKVNTASGSSVAESPPFSFKNSLKWRKAEKSEPLYILIDSIDEKLVIIDFCAIFAEPNSPGYLIIEKHNFFETTNTADSDNENPVASIKTSSTGSTIFESEPGKNLYRVIFRPENEYAIRIISDTIFHLGDRLRIYEIMSSEGMGLKSVEWKRVVRNIQPDQWVPILRIVMNTPTAEESVKAVIDFVSILPRQVIRIVNNDDNKEVNSFLNRLKPANYPHTKRGYTLIAYGWSDGFKFKELDCSIRVTTIEGEPTFRQIYAMGTKPPNTMIQELSKNYVPNIFNIVGKWRVTIIEDSLISLRLSTSYKAVETRIRITDKCGKILCEATGGSVLIIPAVYLPLIPEEDSDDSSILDLSRHEYFIGGYVADDSWPLTNEEWKVAEDVRAEGTVYDPLYRKISVSSLARNKHSRAKLTGRNSEDGEIHHNSQTIFKHPFCKLQVLVDAGGKVQIEEDRIRETEIENMKRLWEDAEPGRLLRGKELREKFFSNNNSRESIFDIEKTGSEFRSLKPPASLSRILPSWKEIFHFIEDDDVRFVKSEEDEEMRRNEREMNLIEFDESQAIYLEQDAERSRDERQRHFDLFNSYVQRSKDFQILRDSGYEKREAYLTSKNVNSAPNNKKKNRNQR